MKPTRALYAVALFSLSITVAAAAPSSLAGQELAPPSVAAQPTPLAWDAPFLHGSTAAAPVDTGLPWARCNAAQSVTIDPNCIPNCDLADIYCERECRKSHVCLYSSNCTPASPCVTYGCTCLPC